MKRFTFASSSLVVIATLLFSNTEAHSQDTDDPRYAIAEERMLEIGRAIERLYEDKGVLLVDLLDDDRAEGIGRMQDDFDSVGYEPETLRTARDVLQPLVHFGYLDEIPYDPFITQNTNPMFNTFVYLDEEDDFEGRDGVMSATSRSLRVVDANHWTLYSPGMDGQYRDIGREDPDLISVTRYQVYMNEPYYPELLERAESNLRILGEAVHQLHQDFGVLLVDYWDDDTAWGHVRLSQVFENAGNLPESSRQFDAVFEPLIHFGYLDSIPDDPFLHPFPGAHERRQAYIYADNDPAGYGADNGFSSIIILEVGEWLITANLARPNQQEYIGPDLRLELGILFTSRDIGTGITGWELY